MANRSVSQALRLLYLRKYVPSPETKDEVGWIRHVMVYAAILEKPVRIEHIGSRIALRIMQHRPKILH